MKMEIRYLCLVQLYLLIPQRVMQSLVSLLIQTLQPEQAHFILTREQRHHVSSLLLLSDSYLSKIKLLNYEEFLCFQTYHQQVFNFQLQQAETPINHAFFASTILPHSLISSHSLLNCRTGFANGLSVHFFQYILHLFNHVSKQCL